MSRAPLGPLPAVLAAAAVLGAPALANATVVRALTLQQKCQVAPVIVYGVVERVEGRWDEAGASIETLIGLRVVEGLKGGVQPGARLLVRQGGGEVDGRRQVAAGMSRFEPGEEAVLFLEPMGPYLVEIGIGVGKYPIAPASGQKWVTHAPEVSQLRVDPRGHSVVEPVPPMEPTPLYQFLKRVRSHVAGLPTEVAQPRKGVRLRPPPFEKIGR